MPLSKSSKTTSKKPMTDAQLTHWEASRDLEAELVESVRQMKRGLGTVVHSPVIAARQNSGLSQAQFAQLLGVSVRTLQGWEQGRKQPSGAARTLITLAQRNPQALRDLAST
ncbi:MAG: helix-turn-helix domain-containing protein [Rhodoferax sp.]|nr:helix-turn-helix domain-containing protein [Rhodoferax sp.]